MIYTPTEKRHPLNDDGYCVVVIDEEIASLNSRLQVGDIALLTQMQLRHGVTLWRRQGCPEVVDGSQKALDDLAHHARGLTDEKVRLTRENARLQKESLVARAELDTLKADVEQFEAASVGQRRRACASREDSLIMGRTA
jgi:hypothetical protein